MRARPPETRVEARHVTIRTPIEADDGTVLPPLEVRVPIEHADLLDASASPGVAPLVALAVGRGEDLVVEGPVDARTAELASGLAALLSGWWGHRPTRVEVLDTFVAEPGGDGVGLYFTRGVDSWSTLLDLLDAPAEDRVTHLLAAFHRQRGNPRGNEAHLIEGHQRVADELGLPLIRLETNARRLIDPHIDWFRSFSPVLVGAGLHVAAGLRRLVLTGAHAVDVATETGAAPEIKALCGTTRTEVALGNPDRMRHERVAHLLTSDLARRTLQVCSMGADHGNCGWCSKCQMTMVLLLLAGDPEPDRGFGHRPDPDVVRSFELGPGYRRFVEPVVEGLAPEHEELRRAWSDARRRSAGDEPLERWGVDAPPGLAGPGTPQRVAAALTHSTGQADAPAPRPLGWRSGAVPLRPALADHDSARTAVAATADRPRAWAVVEHHIAAETRDGLQSALALRLARRHGPGACYVPGILWDHTAAPSLDADVGRRLLGVARARLWWRTDGDLDPLRVVESVEAGCLPLQVMPNGAAHDLAAALPAPLVPLVVADTELDDLDLSPTGVRDRLGPAVEHLLAGSAEHDLLVGAYG